MIACSPPAWGWSVTSQSAHSFRCVLPTRVGMVRGIVAIARAALGAPHPRGDGPDLVLPQTVGGQCSPPAWGWSDGRYFVLAVAAVLPTRVGMVRTWCFRRPSAASAPHPRGDGPKRARLLLRIIMCSPPAWGWSAFPTLILDCNEVLPTRVGMVRKPIFLLAIP